MALWGVKHLRSHCQWYEQIRGLVTHRLPPCSAITPHVRQ